MSCLVVSLQYSLSAQSLLLTSLASTTRLKRMQAQQKETKFTKLFVGGLPYHTTDAALKEYFYQFGDIDEAVVIHDKVTKKSKGYGFVSFTLHTQSPRIAASSYNS